jgi:aminoglycoside phosphotransferase (APT) family kinase protein
MIESATPDAARIARIIHAQFPALDPVRVRFLGEGCDSSAFEVNDVLVFRFPKRADVEKQLLTEARFLEALAASRPPIPIPDFQFHGMPTAEFPRHFGGYPKLPGRSAIDADPRVSDPAYLAPSLGRFLSWLHAFPADEAIRLGVPDQRDDSVLREVSAEALEALDVVKQVSPDAPLNSWRRFLERPPSSMPPSCFAVVHNDLAAEHVLVDSASRSVTGIIDWSDVAVGDRAIDVAGMCHWGGAEFLETVLSEYDGTIDDGLRARARYFAACRGVLDVAFGIERDRPEYVNGGLRAIAMTIGPQPRQVRR